MRNCEPIILSFNFLDFSVLKKLIISILLILNQNVSFLIKDPLGIEYVLQL